MGKHEVLLPHEVFHAIHSEGGPTFKNMLLGGDDANFQDYWARDKSYHPNHPLHTESPDIVRRTCPIGLHGDGVADVKDDQVCKQRLLY